MYMDVDIQDDYLNIIFLVSFLWSCATFAVVFYGVDSVDLAGKVDLKNKENFQWINVRQISFFLFFSSKNIFYSLSLLTGSGLEDNILVGAKACQAYPR